MAVSEEVRHQVEALVNGGDKIQAIKVLRDAARIGLAEAREMVEAIERGENPATPDPPDGIDEAVLSDVRRLLAAGKKIEAIKIHREATGAMLADSKAFVEDLAANLSPDRVGEGALPGDTAHSAVKKGGCFSVIVTALFLAGGGVLAVAAMRQGWPGG